MGVYEDMANDAGYPYGTDENMQMASMMEADEHRRYLEHQMELAEEERRELAEEERREILFRKFDE
jgi:hypothetical protein